MPTKLRNRFNFSTTDEDCPAVQVEAEVEFVLVLVLALALVVLVFFVLTLLLIAKVDRGMTILLSPFFNNTRKLRFVWGGCCRCEEFACVVHVCCTFPNRSSLRRTAGDVCNRPMTMIQQDGAKVSVVFQSRTMRTNHRDVPLTDSFHKKSHSNLKPEKNNHVDVVDIGTTNLEQTQRAIKCLVWLGCVCKQNKNAEGIGSYRYLYDAAWVVTSSAAAEASDD